MYEFMNFSDPGLITLKRKKKDQSDRLIHIFRQHEEFLQNIMRPLTMLQINMQSFQMTVVFIKGGGKSS